MPAEEPSAQRSSRSPSGRWVSPCATSAWMRPAGVALACAFAWAAACGPGKQPQPQPSERRDGGRDGDPSDAQTLDIPARTLGLPDLAAFAWRKRGGHPAYRLARIAEAKQDWATVATTCQQALAADPGHLEAAYLLAAALGNLGKHDAVVAPLQLAASGDFGKWGPASLELPELQGFLATPLGQAWQRRVEQDRATYAAALGRSVLVMADGDLYAYDVETTRWYRVTRTFGSVVGALRLTPSRIAYGTRQRVKKSPTTLALGTIDLARGRTSRAIELATRGPITIAFSTKQSPGVWVGNGTRPTSWRKLDDDVLTALPGKLARPGGPWLEVKGKHARLHALPVAGVIADWDDRGFASAARIAKSSRVVSVPSPGLIDGNTMTWSPDRSHLAFVVKLDDQCVSGTQNTAAFVADTTTGAIHELERAVDGLAIEWVTDRKLVIAGDHGVALVDLDGTPAVQLAGAEGLIAPRRRPACTPEGQDVDAEPVEVDVPPGDEADPVPSGVGGGPVDAGVVDAR